MFFGKLHTNKKVKFISIIFISFLILFTAVRLVFAVSESDCLNKNINELSDGEKNDCIYVIIPRIIAAYTPAQEQNKKDLAGLQTQLSDINKRLKEMANQLVDFEKNITGREEDLGFVREIFNRKTSSHYVAIRTSDPVLLLILSSNNASDAIKEIMIRQKVSDQDRKQIEEYANELNQLKKDKESLEKNKIGLAALQKQVSEKATFLSGEVAKVEQYLTTLSGKQQEILNAKNGSFIASVGDSALADDYNASIKGFNEAAPSGSFAVFSFGAYTHRKGMSQYGARGRAASQDYKQILKAYYGKEPVQKDTSGTINVTGYGAIDFETTYLYGIAEMPSSWPDNALKAQAVAARTYAYRYKLNGTSICTNEGCQVFNKGKSDNTPDSWKQAVSDTRGQILEDVVTFYSSTTGGYITTMGWDTTDGSGGSNFFDKSYEKIGGSPWAYKAWYRQGYTSSGATCGEGNPWLSNEEFADIVNAAIVLKSGPDSRITPITTSCWGGNPYSHDELRVKGGVSSVSSVSVSQGDGTTKTVTVNGISFSGEEFKQAFNLRAPGYLSIPQKGFAFFNIEKK